MNTSELTVLYDGGCPLCSREIRHYRRLDRMQRIRWVDVTQQDPVIAGYGITRDEALAVFHVFDGNGRVFKGAAGFVRLWSEIPRYRLLSAFVRKLRLMPVLNWAYGRFARWHFEKRCRQGACNASTVSSTH